MSSAVPVYDPRNPPEERVAVPIIMYSQFP
jgi:hypothetical protein